MMNLLSKEKEGERRAKVYKKKIIAYYPYAIDNISINISCLTGNANRSNQLLGAA